MKEENIGAAIARALGIRAKQAEATIALLDEGNTVPFISRYRKEATGELDEEQVRSVESELSRLRNLVKRQQEIEKRKTSTCPSSRNGARARASRGKRDWSRWRSRFSHRKRIAARRKNTPRNSSMRKRA